MLPFQICFTGALAFGLVHLLLADHDGPMSKRDAIGLLAGLLALMCSGVGVTMVAVVGFAVLLRRGWKLALFHTVPLAACYLVWLFTVGNDDYGTTRVTSRGMFGFVSTGLRAAYRSMGQIPGLGVVFVMLLVAGFVLAWNQRRETRRTPELAAPIALLAGSVLFLTITATGRLILGANTASLPRYTYLVTAMTLPALAVAFDAFTTRWRRFFPIAIALFLVGIPANIGALRDANKPISRIQQGTRRIMLPAPRVPLATEVPRSIVIEPITARQVTIGWLLDGVAQGRVPSPGTIGPVDAGSATFRLSFEQRRETTPTTGCVKLGRPRVFELEKGDVIGLSANAIRVRPAPGRPFVGPPLFFAPTGKPIVVVHTQGAVELSPAHVFFPARVCIEKM
jgi:hypothetical protein